MNGWNQRTAKQLLDRIRDRKIVVLGDVMLDEFVWGDVTRISPEAPVPVVDIRRESVHLGGAANVLANLVALGAQACVIGVIGKDAAGDRLRVALAEANPGQSDNNLIVDDSRPSTTKTRIIAHNQLVVRADREQRTPVSSRDREPRHQHSQKARSKLPMLWWCLTMTKASSPRASWQKFCRWLTGACRC